jgi:hypothetical protein
MNIKMPPFHFPIVFSLFSFGFSSLLTLFFCFALALIMNSRLRLRHVFLNEFLFANKVLCYWNKIILWLWNINKFDNNFQLVNNI